jgi:LCP family protein required for cell wall assembly
MAVRVLLAGVVVLVVAAAIVARTIQGEAELIVDSFAQKTPEAAETRGALSGVERGKPQTLLLIGDDTRHDEPGQRSDTMILVRLDPDAKATTMLSLPRDLAVDIGGSTRKLNESFTGGAGPLITKLKSILSTPGEPFEIHHYVTIGFTAFSQAVNAFGCFYADIDRRYFNDNAPPTGGGPRYAEIDVKSGYQRLCGEDALQYVRFRHVDNDLVREARQSHYLAEARGQIAASSLLLRQQELAKTILQYVTTDIDTTRGLLGVVGLGLDVVGRSTDRVELEVTDAGANLATTPAALAQAARDFLHPKESPAGSAPSSAAGSAKPRKPRRVRTRKVATTRTDLDAARSAVRDAGIDRTFRGAPVYVPKVMQSAARYEADESRAYDIASPGGRKFPWQGYRLVVELPGIGQYYGVQGTTWTKPPVLKLATDEIRLGGRTFSVEYDGRRIRRLVWETPTGTYWITNSLNSRLKNDEMRAIARSLVRVG